MCTLVVFRNVDPRFPLVIAANRDERPTRPTQNPAELGGGVYAPLDLVHKGTWIGVNRHGLIASLTNRFLAPRHHGRRSRGLLVTEALAARTTAHAVAAILLRPPGTYNGFQLFLDDGREAALVWSDAGEYFVERLGNGIWIFTGDDAAPGDSRRNEVVREWMRSAPRLGDLDWLKRLLSFHGPEPADGTCVHGRQERMESIFSMVIRRPADNRALDVHWRAGRPCRNGRWHEAAVTVDQPEPKRRKR